MINYFKKLIFLSCINYIFIYVNLTLSLSLTILLHNHTYVTAVTNGAIKVTFNGTTHNRTLVNSLPDQ